MDVTNLANHELELRETQSIVNFEPSETGYQGVIEAYTHQIDSYCLGHESRFSEIIENVMKKEAEYSL